LRIENDLKLDFSDVLIRPKRSTLASRSEVSLEREFIFRNSKQSYKGIPIMAANMDGVGTFTIAEVLANYGMFTCLVKHYPVDDLVEWIYTIGSNNYENWAYSLGITEPDLEKFSSVWRRTLDQDNVNRSIKYICIDVANGYSERFVDFIKRFRELYPELVLIAGNVVTGEMTEELILNGVDIVKVGIGPGSVCTTRIKTGVGYPQLSAIVECADAAHGLAGHIIADGGCTSPGDVAKAFGAGADFVMLGGMLAGHNEGGGEIIRKLYETNELDVNGHHITKVEQFVQFYGMSSVAANEKHFGGLKDYRASEGREVLIPYRGDIENTIQDLLGGLRSSCTYVGASKLKELSKRTTFIRVNNTHNRVYESKTTKA
jgi:GMP reductase